MKLASLSLVFSFLVVGCGKGPQVTVCVSDPGAGGFQCVDPQGVVTLLTFNKTGNYVCFSPTDARTLLEAASVKGKEVAQHIDERPQLKREMLARGPLRKAYFEMKTGKAYVDPFPFGEEFIKDKDRLGEAE